METNSIDLEDSGLDCWCCFCQIRCVKHQVTVALLGVAAVRDCTSSWSLLLPKLFCISFNPSENIRGALVLEVLLIRKAKGHLSGLRRWHASWFKSCLALSCSAPLSPLQFFCHLNASVSSWKASDSLPGEGTEDGNGSVIHWDKSNAKPAVRSDSPRSGKQPWNLPDAMPTCRGWLRSLVSLLAAAWSGWVRVRLECVARGRSAFAWLYEIGVTGTRSYFSLSCLKSSPC